MSGSSATAHPTSTPAVGSVAPFAGVLVLGGGTAPHPAVADHLGTPSLVIAADAGWDHARALGLHVDLLVGDLDSLPGASVDAAEAAGTRILRLERDKDATDLEVALDLAAAAPQAERGVAFVGGTGDGERLDHLAAQLPLLASPAYAHVHLHALIGTAWLAPVHGASSRTVHGQTGDYVTLLPVGGPVDGVRTEGLRFALTDETLDPFRTRGVSNELSAPTATVHVQRGSLLVIRPHALSPH